MRNILLGAMVMAVSPLVFAAASAPAATQAQQDRAAGEHAGHTMPVLGSEAQGRVGKERGMSRPTAWTSFPILKAKMSGEGREGRSITLVPQGIVANSIVAYSNDIKDASGQRQLPFDMAGAKLDKPASGGLHWLAAREEQGDEVRVASTVYYFSNPGKNPTAIFMQQKHELEIIPQPFPREHSRYRANEDWKFLVRFNSKPQANHKVSLETGNGTKAELVSDAQGIITMHVPDDFKSESGQKTAGEHSHGRRSSDFVLATEYREGGKNYLTAFNGSYGPGAFDQRSLAMGLGFTLLGMAGAVPLLRQRKSAKQAGDAMQSSVAETANNKDA
jgi:hypothetical protein